MKGKEEDARAGILVVDDELGIRESFRMLLKDRYKVVTASSGQEALGILDRDGESIDLVLLDIRMPEMDGISVLREVKERRPDIEVAMVTAYASVDTARTALKYGALDYLIKPFDRQDVYEMVGRGVDKKRERSESKALLQRLQLVNDALVNEVRRAREDIHDHFEGTVKALIAAIDAKDHYTAGHSERVAILTRCLGETWGISGKELDLLSQAAQVHDIGKIGVSEAVLRKRGPLMPDEMTEMRMHPAIGAEILGPVNFLRDMIPAVLLHHERYDGTGYQQGLKSDSIALYARIVSVADAVDAMGSDRPYRLALPPEKIWASLSAGAGSQFDPELVQAAFDVRLPYIQKQLASREET